MPVIVKPTTIGAPEFVPERLRAARLDAGLSIEGLAVAIGRRWSTVIRYERGDILPSAHVLGALAHVLGCKIDDFYGPADRT